LSGVEKVPAKVVQNASRGLMVHGPNLDNEKASGGSCFQATSLLKRTATLHISKYCQQEMDFTQHYAFSCLKSAQCLQVKCWKA